MSSQERLDALFQSSPQSDRVAQRLGAHAGEPFLLFGAGQTARGAIAKLGAAGVGPAACLDETPSKIGSSVGSVPVMSTAEGLRGFGSAAPVFVSVFQNGHAFVRTADRLRAIGFEAVFPFPALGWMHPGLVPFFFFDQPGRLREHETVVRRVHGMLEDEKSRARYARFLELRQNLAFADSADADSEPFLAPAQSRFHGEDMTFIDCGAFDGDTLRAFIAQADGRIRRVIAYEPDGSNFDRLSRCVASLDAGLRSRIELRRAAVGAVRATQKLDARGTSSSRVSDAGTDVVEVERLDDLALSTGALILKLDVEGSELDALRGASRLIRELRPLLAVSVYHRPEDLWELPLLIDSLVDGYRYALIQHAEDGIDMTLYAVPG